MIGIDLTIDPRPPLLCTYTRLIRPGLFRMVIVGRRSRRKYFNKHHYHLMAEAADCLEAITRIQAMSKQGMQMNTKFSLTAIALLAGLQIPQCAPIYYYFTGVVTASDTSAHAVGSNVSYQFLVKPDTAGYVIENGNTQHYSSTVGVNIFYGRYLSGDALPSDAPYVVTMSEFLVVDNFGPASPHTSFSGSNADPSGKDGITIQGNYAFADIVADPSLTFHGQNTVFSKIKDASGRQITTTILSDLSLIYVGSVPMSEAPAPAGAVPEPTTLALAGLGLVGLLAMGRRKQG